MYIAICRMADLQLKGYVEDAGDGLYWFTSEDREEMGMCRFLVPATDVLIVAK